MKRKYFCGAIIRRGVQMDAAVLTTSQKRAAEIAETSIGDIRTYWSSLDDPPRDHGHLEPDILYVNKNGIGWPKEMAPYKSE